MSLKIVKETSHSTIYLKLEGILDISTCDEMELHLKDLHLVKEVILDFSNLHFIDSTGIGTIMNGLYMSIDKNFELKLQGMNDYINMVLETVGLFNIMDFMYKNSNDEMIEGSQYLTSY